jgi:hypothetical protein
MLFPSERATSSSLIDVRRPSNNHLNGLKTHNQPVVKDQSGSITHGCVEITHDRGRFSNERGKFFSIFSKKSSGALREVTAARKYAQLEEIETEQSG